MTKFNNFLNEGKEKKWMGTLPTKCDICNQKLTKGWVDGVTSMGPWANMCFTCFKKYGKGLGTGKGQKYDMSGIKIQG